MLKYFYWLVFVGTLFIASEMLRTAQAVQQAREAWLDVLANYALLGMVGIVVAVAVCALLAGVEMLGHVSKSQMLRAIPQAFVFSLFVAVWLNILRLMLAAYGIKLGQVPALFQLLGFFIVGAVAFVLYKTALSDWIDKTSVHLRMIVWVIIAIYLSLTGYSLVKSLDQGRPAPVTIASSGRRPPNVIFIVLDGLSKQDMSLYGYSLPTTPNLDRLTRTWTIYENAHSTGTGTNALLPTILTGRYPYFIDQWRRYGDLTTRGEGWMSLAEILQSFGYKTVYTFNIGYSPYHFGLQSGFDEIWSWKRTSFDFIDFLILRTDPVLTWMFVEYVPLAYVPLSSVASLYPVSARVVSEPMYETADRWFRKAALSETPFFAYIHMHRPNRPYIGDEFLGTFLPVEEGLADIESQNQVFARNPYPPDQQPLIDRLRLRYDENIRKADEQVGRLIETLQQLGLYDQVLIIVTADHGQTFKGGYHGNHTPLLAAAEHSIPLLVKLPGQTEGRRVTGLVSNVDIMPTILDVIGASYPSSWVDGLSLLQARENSDRVVYVRTLNETFAWQENTMAVLSRTLKLVNRNGSLFLYDLAADPDEQINLLGQLKADNLQDALEQFARRIEFLRAGGETTEAPGLITRAEQ